MVDIGGFRGPDLDVGLALETPRELRDIRRFSHEAMASVFEVYAVHADERYAAQAARAAFDVVDRLEADLSRFRSNSDISRINQLAAGQSTRVGPSTLECLVIARHVFELTQGVFDISVGTGLPAIEVDPDACVVRAATGGVQVDLGGIGKGYAVDLMAELLEEWELPHALVHGGFSSVLALDVPDGFDGWPLTLSDPGAPSRVLERLTVRQTVLGASGVRKGPHIVDPRTGEPVAGRVAAWVAVPRPDPSERAGGLRLAAAAVADALTTACMILSEDDIEALCDRSPGLRAWVLPTAEDGASVRADVRHFGG